MSSEQPPLHMRVFLFMVLEKGRSRKKRAAKMAENLKPQIEKINYFRIRTAKSSYCPFPALRPVPHSGAYAPPWAFTHSRKKD